MPSKLLISENISEIRVLSIRQIAEGHLIPLGFIEYQSVPSLVFISEVEV